MPQTRIDELRKRLEKDPESRLFAQLAEELRKEGEVEEAIRVCRDGLRANPDYPSARMTLGRALLDTGDLRGARAEFESVLRGAADNILASRLLAECLEGLGDVEGALARYRATMAMAPEDRLSQSRERELSQQLAAMTGGTRPDAVVSAPPPPIVAPVPPSAASAPPLEPPAIWGEESEAVPPAAAEEEEEPAPIPLVAAEEEFELESAYESAASGWTGMATVSPEPPPRAFEARESPAIDEATTESSGGPIPAEPLVFDEGVPESLVAPREEPLASATLAELYLRQGLTDRAIQVYRQVLDREPSNEAARARLSALEAPGGGMEMDEIETEAQPGPGGRDEAVQRTIGRLEKLLDALTHRRYA